MWPPLVVALILFAVCYETGALLLRKAAPNEETQSQLTDVALRARRASLPVVLLIAIGYFIWMKVDPERAAGLYKSAVVLILGTLLASIIYAWVKSIRVAKDDKPLRYKLATAYSLELLGVLLASAVARFL